MRKTTNTNLYTSINSAFISHKLPFLKKTFGCYGLFNIIAPLRL